MTELKKFNAENLAAIQEIFSRRVYALTPATHGDQWIAGVAVANERGYRPLPASWCNIDQGPQAYDTMADYLDAVNRSIAGLDDSAANKIIASSMRE